MLKNLLMIFITMSVLCIASAGSAAPIGKMRLNVSPARVRIVLDSEAPIAYRVDKDDLELAVELPESTVLEQDEKLRDTAVKSIRLHSKGKKAGRLTVRLKKDCQYKIYQLNNPHRLVLDIFRINIVKKTQQLAKGVSYTYLQDELNGRQIQAHLVEVAKDARYEIRPFSAAGAYNGRALLSREAKQEKLLAAVNASYFDSDGWVIGNTKRSGQLLSMDKQPRSAFLLLDDKPQIVQDVAYSGRLRLSGGVCLEIKGMNRRRIADDLVLYNEHYAPTTRTNAYGRELKLHGNRVIAVATAGNMSIEPGTVVISAHGSSAAALAGVRVGDRIFLHENLGSREADAAETLISGGPLLLEDGHAHVRAHEEAIPGDIARGRAPRTALGIKRDGTVQLLVVDGRSNNSAGLTLEELAQYFLRIGAADAVNFDGGGSSIMLIKGRIVNKPSDGRERPVSMGMGLFTKK